MSEPEQVTRFLAEFRRALTGGRKHRRAIVDEIRAHLLDGIAARDSGPEAERAVLRDFGDPLVAAAGFNRLRTRRSIRRLGCAGALVLASALGAAAVLGLPDQPASRLPVYAHAPATSKASPSFRIAVIDPKTRRLIRVARAGSSVQLPATNTS